MILSRRRVSVFIPVLILASLVICATVLFFDETQSPFSNPRTEFTIAVEDPKSLVLLDISRNRGVADSVLRLEITEDRREFLDMYFQILLNNSMKSQRIFFIVPSYMIVSSLSVLLGSGSYYRGIDQAFPELTSRPYLEVNSEYMGEFDVSVCEIQVNSLAFSKHISTTYNMTHLDFLKIKIKAMWYGLICDSQTSTRVIFLELELNRHSNRTRQPDISLVLSQFRSLVMDSPPDAVCKPSDITPQPDSYSRSRISWENRTFDEPIVVSYARHPAKPSSYGISIGLFASSLAIGVASLVAFLKSGLELRERNEPSRMYDVGCISILAVFVGFAFSYLYASHVIVLFFTTVWETSIGYYVEPFNWLLPVAIITLFYLVRLFLDKELAAGFVVTLGYVTFISIGLSCAQWMGYSLVDFIAVPAICVSCLLILILLERELCKSKGSE